MLDSHPLILGGPEFLHLPDIIDLRRKLHVSIDLEWIDLFFNKNDIDRYIIAIVEKIFLPLADKYHCQYYSEKTPDNILVFSELIDLFPESHFIYVNRDPRGIVSSMKRVKERAIKKGIKPPHFCGNTAKSIAYTNRCIQAGFKASEKAPDKVLNLVFEKLLLNPEEETNRICKFIGVEWHEGMLQPGNKEHLGAQAITTKSNELWYNKDSYNQNVVIQNKEKWKRQLTNWQKIKVTWAFKDNVKLLESGYDFSLENMTQNVKIAHKGYVCFLWFSFWILKSLQKGIRKLPGIKIIRNGTLAIAKYLG
jgi:hypothetical protein